MVVYFFDAEYWCPDAREVRESGHPRVQVGGTEDRVECFDVCRVVLISNTQLPSEVLYQLVNGLPGVLRFGIAMGLWGAPTRSGHIDHMPTFISDTSTIDGPPERSRFE